MVPMEVGIPWIFLANLEKLVLSWKLLSYSFFGNQLWRLMLLSVCWTLWLEKNQRCFEIYVEPSLLKFLERLGINGVFKHLIVVDMRVILLWI